jgi:hypothetical protein
MRDRLNQRLSNITKLRYYLSIGSSINSYNNDWHMIAHTIMDKHYDEIFKSNKYSFCFIVNETRNQIITCFDQNLRNINRGPMTIDFFIMLLLYLSNNRNKLSKINSRDILTNNDSDFGKVLILLEDNEKNLRKYCELLSKTQQMVRGGFRRINKTYRYKKI